MDTENFDNLLELKNNELMKIYENKINKNKKMINNQCDIDYNSKQLYNKINAGFEQKFKLSKAYQRMLEIEYNKTSI
jgi:hypothetical protein